MSADVTGATGPGRDHVDDYAELQAQLEYQFDDPSLLERALTHRSFLTEHAEVDADNQRLEFLGDAVLGLAVADDLFHRDREVDEGILSKRLARLVRRSALADVARELELGDYLRLGKGEAQTGGRSRESLLADAYEAVLAAVYLDGGFEAAKEVVRHLQERMIEEAVETQRPTDFKSRLQEVTQREANVQPAYQIIDETGPAHDKTFVAEVRIEGDRFGTGEGRSKQRAEQRAAEQALDRLEDEP